jgi:hypothetical protein
MSTDRKLSWCDRIDAQGGVDSPRSSGFRIIVRRMSSSSSFVQVLRMAVSTSLAKRECYSGGTPHVCLVCGSNLVPTLLLVIAAM